MSKRLKNYRDADVLKFQENGVYDDVNKVFFPNLNVYSFLVHNTVGLKKVSFCSFSLPLSLSLSFPLSPSFSLSHVLCFPFVYLSLSLFLFIFLFLPVFSPFSASLSPSILSFYLSISFLFSLSLFVSFTH